MINFIPKYEYSETEFMHRCGYCQCHISLRKFSDGTMEKSYKLNGKYICWSCLRDKAHFYGKSVSEFIGGIK